MLLVVSQDLSLLARLEAELRAREVPFTTADAAVLGAESRAASGVSDPARPAPLPEATGALFMKALEVRATEVLVIERLPRVGEPAKTAGDAAVAELVSAARAPGVRRVLLATSRASSDLAIERLRRDGAPYLVLRTDGLVEMKAAVERIERPVAVDTKLSFPAGLATIGHLTSELVAAIGRPDVMGQIIEVETPKDELGVRLVVESGHQAEPVSGARALWRRITGAPRITLRPEGPVLVRGAFA